jgi:hypothetical protein
VSDYPRIDVTVEVGKALVDGLAFDHDQVVRDALTSNT